MNACQDFATGVPRGLSACAEQARAGLHPARHLYDAQGFVCVHQAIGTQWGRPVREQRLLRRRPGA